MTTVPPAPTARGATRQALLAAVAQLRGTLEAHLEASEAAGTLAQASVEACQAAGLYGLKLPTVLGGFEADPLVQIDVIVEKRSLSTGARGLCAFVRGELCDVWYTPVLLPKGWAWDRQTTVFGPHLPVQHLPQLLCPHGGEHLGVPIIYQKEQRLAFRLFAGAVTTQIHKRHSR
jgi:hypothetical protein